MWYLRTFGGLSLETDGRAVSAATRRRPLGLLALLAVAGERGWSREKIVALLWPESDEEHGRNSLSQALVWLRRDLAADDAVVGMTELRLNPSVITGDVGEFERCAASGALERAAALYHGPFLDGFFVREAADFERWVDEQRRRLHDSYAGALQRLARAADVRSDHEGAVGWWRRLASLEPTSAQATAGLMRALAMMGDRAGARRHYRVYEELMRHEFGAQPEPAVTTLAASLFTQLTDHSIPVIGATPPGSDRLTARTRLEHHLVADAPLIDRVDHPEPTRPTASLVRRIRRNFRVRLFAPFGTLALVGIGAFVLRTRPLDRPNAPRAGNMLDPRTVAVLYFDAPHRADSLIVLSGAITEVLIERLRGVDSIRAISSSGVQEFRGMRIRADSIARVLDAGTLIGGSLTAVGDSLRLRIQLTDGRTGGNVQEATLTGTHDQLFAFLDSASVELARLLQQRLGQEVALRRLAPGTQSVRAWEAFQRVKQATAGSRVDSVWRAESPQAALKLLESSNSDLRRVQEMDKTWAEPTVLRGLNDITLVRSAAVSPEVPKWLDDAANAADDALKLSPGDAEALEVRGDVGFFRYLLSRVVNRALAPGGLANLLKDSERDLRGAVQVDPRNARAWASLSFVLLQRSRIREAAAAAREAYRLDPYAIRTDQDIWRAFQGTFGAGDESEAKRWCELGGHRFPTNPRFVECRLWLFQMKGQHPTAEQLWTAYEYWLALWCVFRPS